MTILQNAIDSIQLGVEDYELIAENPKRLVSCVRNLFSGILLLFKSHLVNLSPEGSNDLYIKLRHQEVSDKNGNKVIVGIGNSTINFKGIIDKFGDLNIQVEWTELERVQEYRNNIEHYFSTDNPKAVQAILTHSFNIINAFTRDYLKREPIELFGEDVWSIFIEIENVYQKEKQNCSEALATNEYVHPQILELIKKSYCPCCGFDLVEPQEKNIEAYKTKYKCLSCFHELDFEEYLVTAIDQFVNEQQLYNSRFANQFEGIFCICSECWKNTYSLENKKCFNCEFQAVHVCRACEIGLTGDEISYGYKLCSSCRNKFEKTMGE